MDYLDERTYAATRLPVEAATTLIPAAYHDPAFYAAEQQNVWARGWVAVAVHHEVAAPGHAVVRAVAGRSVVIVADARGELRAFLNVCRHRGTQLVADDGPVGARIRCPYHAWAYDLDGTLVGTPLFEGSGIPEDMRDMFDMSAVKEFDRADYGLFPVRVAAWGGVVFVALSEDVPDLAAWLGDLPDRLGGYGLEAWEVQASRTYGIGADWKLVAENFMEYYHLPWVHPELVKVSRMADHHRYQGPGMYTGMTTSPVSRDENPVWLDLPPHAGVTGADLVSGRFMLVFPNAALAVLPNHAFVMLLEPDGPGRTVERTYLLAHPDTMADEDSEPALRRLHDFWDDVNREDIEIVERVQAGVTTPEYRGGRMCYRFEEPLHRFQNMVIDRLVGIDRIPPGDEVDAVP